MAPKLAVQRQAPRVQPDPRITKVQDTQRKVYLVTIPHPRASKPIFRLRKKTAVAPGPPLASPSDLDRAGVERAFLDAAQHPVYEDSRNAGRGGSVELHRMAIFMELHQPLPGAVAGAPRPCGDPGQAQLPIPPLQACPKL